MIVVSHRGPVSYRQESDGSFSARRGAGGVVSALAPLLRGRADTHWIAAALSADDRAAVGAGAVDATDLGVELLTLDPEDHRLHSEVIANQLLWFWTHGLFDLVRPVADDPDIGAAWAAYRRINDAFADAVCAAAAPGDTVLIQDYQLLLVAAAIRSRRSDLAVTQFIHTPFSGAADLDRLPPAIATEIVAALGAAATGFHTRHWVDAAQNCVDAHTGDATLFAATFGPDPTELEQVAASPAAAAAATDLAHRVGARACIVRADRMELSKNIVRGFLAYDRLLERRPEWRGAVVFVAMLNPSREAIGPYREYRAEVESAAAAVNARWATADWEPVVLDTRDDFPRSVAALRRADVFLVNPVRDGLNLVALEGPMLNPDAALCLSREAGAFEYLGDAAVAVDPLDIDQTAEALHTALAMPPGERADRAAVLNRTARAHPASEWLAELVRRAG